MTLEWNVNSVEMKSRFQGMRVMQWIIAKWERSNAGIAEKHILKVLLETTRKCVRVKSKSKRKIGLKDRVKWDMLRLGNVQRDNLQQGKLISLSV